MDQQDLVTSGIPNPAQSGSVQTVTPAKSDVSAISQTTVLGKLPLNTQLKYLLG